MAKDDIPIQDSKFGGTPITDVRSAQEALQGMMNPRKEQGSEDQQATETTEEVSEQDMESESVDIQASNPDGLTTDDIGEEENTQEEIEEQQRYTVKAAGKKHEVTLEELKKGFQFEADYTRKNEELGEDRRKVSEEKRMLSQELEATQKAKQQYLSSLEDIDQIVDSDIKAFESTDWATLKIEDPVQYSLKREEFRELHERKAKVANEKQKHQYEAAVNAEKKVEEVKIEQQQIVSGMIPNWSDPVEGPKIKSRIKNFAIKSGFSEQDLSQLIDARSVDILHKAMKYDDLVNSKIKGKKLKNIPKVTRPGSPATRGEISGDKVKAQKARLRKSGHINDASSLIESLMTK